MPIEGVNIQLAAVTLKYQSSREKSHHQQWKRKRKRVIEEEEDSMKIENSVLKEIKRGLRPERNQFYSSSEIHNDEGTNDGMGVCVSVSSARHV
jgi:hypothetical protein